MRRENDSRPIRLKARQRAGEIAKADYAAHVAALRDRFPLLGLPVDRWTE
jgi:hypothetical protein